MARKATIENLRRAVDDSAARVSELEKLLEDAKTRQTEAQNKVREREKEIEQENNNELAVLVKKFFGSDISPDEFEKEMDELLLIGEVTEYIKSEKASRREKSKVISSLEKDTVASKAESGS